MSDAGNPRITHTFEPYRDRGRKREHHWRFRAKNGNIVATSGGDGYKRKSTMLKSFAAMEHAIIYGNYDRKDFD